MTGGWFYTVMRVKGRYYLYRGCYSGGAKRLIYVGPCDRLEELWRSHHGPAPAVGDNAGKNRKASYNRLPKLEDLDLDITPALLSQFLRWCVEELGNSEDTCEDRANYLRKPLDIKNSHSVKAYRLLYKMLGKEPPRDLKVPKSGIDLRVPGDDEVFESLEKSRQYETLFLVYKVLIESGARLKEVVGVLNNYDPNNDVNHGRFHTYVVGKVEGSKKSFYIFHVTPLKKLKIGEDHITKLTRGLGLIRPKYVRKWVSTKMISVGIPSEVVDFIQGRTPRSILSRHYLNLYTLALQYYPKYVQFLDSVTIKHSIKY